MISLLLKIMAVSLFDNMVLLNTEIRGGFLVSICPGCLYFKIYFIKYDMAFWDLVQETHLQFPLTRKRLDLLLFNLQQPRSWVWYISQENIYLLEIVYSVGICKHNYCLFTPAGSLALGWVGKDATDCVFASSFWPTLSQFKNILNSLLASFVTQG